MAKNPMFNPGYLSDMAIIDERLKRLERAYEEISQLLTGLSMDIKLITNGGKSGVKKAKEQNAKQNSKR